MTDCKNIGCYGAPLLGEDFCIACAVHSAEKANSQPRKKVSEDVESLSKKYPAYYKDVSHLDEIDVYAVHHVFNIQDPSGSIHHASKKLLLSGVRTGGKSVFKDIKEARDTLSRWLQLNPEHA